MKKTSTCTAVVLLVLAGVTATGAQTVGEVAGGEGKRFDERDFRGTYAAVVTEVRQDDGTPPRLDFCSGHATIVADGRGQAAVDATEKCSRSGLIAGCGIELYQVGPDGTMFLWEPDQPDDRIHCRILEGGRTILCDGSTRESPAVFSFQVVAVRQSHANRALCPPGPDEGFTSRRPVSLGALAR